MAPRVGFEPTAARLTVECSTAELSGSGPAFAGQVCAYTSAGTFGKRPFAPFLLILEIAR